MNKIEIAGITLFQENNVYETMDSDVRIYESTHVDKPYVLVNATMRSFIGRYATLREAAQASENYIAYLEA